MAEEDGKEKSDCVKVAVRMRPPSQKELGNDEKCIVEMEESTGDGSGKVIIHDPEDKDKIDQYAFDIVFGLKTEQPTVYETVGKPALEATLTGYNGTIFAYGQTGSGKSWCMMGGGGELRGIIPRVNERLFERLKEEQEEKPSRRFLVMCSFFEIYNEIIFDLLNPVQDRSKLGAGLQVKEHPVLGIYVKDLQEMVVDESDKLEKLMQTGTKNRAVSSTMMNSVSSRSHSIFIIKVHQKDDEDKSKNVFAKLNLVDLAGSERQKGTGATGQTLKEGANINKSLSALGNVINALVETANGKKVFVPFRNSKLTRVLQESLGGNSLCTMLATLSPAACNYEETLSTLRYANRAKAIKVSATKNEEASQISRLNAEVEELKKKLLSAGSGGTGVMADEERAEIRQKFEMQLKDMEQMLNTTWEEKEKLSKNHETQLNKAIEERKRQEKAMEEECKKRFRLLQDQNDLELTIRALLDTVQALPSKEELLRKREEVGENHIDAAASGSAASSSPCMPLRSGELPKSWLTNAAAISEVEDGLKQQHMMTVVFQGAFSEDVRLWVDAEEVSDASMARAGAKRARTKLETLRRECGRLAGLEKQGHREAEDFASAVSQAVAEWTKVGKAAVLQEIREASVDDAKEANSSETSTEDPEENVSPVHKQAIEDIGRIMKLIEQQARARADEFGTLASLEVRSMAELVLKGMNLTQVNADAHDLAVIRDLLVEQKPDALVTEEAPAAPALPKQDRPLEEWTPEDADGSVEGAEFALRQLVQLDQLNKKRTPQELLLRPPPKFIHDVALLVRQATGFLQSMSEDWPESREARLDLLQNIADSCASSLRIGQLDFDPADVLKGKEVSKTLRLLELMAIAAKREQNNAGGSITTAEAHRDKRKEGTAAASDMIPLLDALVRCIDEVMNHQHKEQEQQKDRPGSGHVSPTRELESEYRALQERLEEELQVRKRREDKLAELQQQLKDARSVLEERAGQLDEVLQAANDFESKKEALRQQVDGLRSGLLARAQQIASETENSEVARIKKELEETVKTLGSKSAMKLKMSSDVKKLQQQQIENDAEKETVENDLKRMKLRFAEGLDGQKTQSNEEIIMLQAETQKWELKVSSLEDKIKAFTEEEESQTAKESEFMEEIQKQNTKNDDYQMQLQVITEERDALREGMDNLWNDMTRVEEDLDQVYSGYTAMSDRLMDKEEEVRDLEEKLLEYENLLSMLQQNFEKNRLSPAPAGPSPAPASPPGPEPAPVAPPQAPSGAYGGAPGPTQAPNGPEIAAAASVSNGPMPAELPGPELPGPVAPNGPIPPPPRPPPGPALPPGHMVQPQPVGPDPPPGDDDASSHYEDDFEEPEEYADDFEPLAS